MNVNEFKFPICNSGDASKFVFALAFAGMAKYVKGNIRNYKGIKNPMERFTALLDDYFKKHPKIKKLALNTGDIKSGDYSKLIMRLSNHVR
jgi:hypothetical protein